MLTAPLLLAVLVWPRTGLLDPRPAARPRGSSRRCARVGDSAACRERRPRGLPDGARLAGRRRLLRRRDAVDDAAGESRRDGGAELVRLAVGTYRFGVAMLVLAAVGAVRLGWRDRRAFVLCTIAFVPYAIFHLLFHETATMRYALPLIVPVALLAATAIDALGRRALTLAGATAVVVSLATTVPAARAYGHDGSPAFRVFAKLPLATLRDPSPAPPASAARAARPRCSGCTPRCGASRSGSTTATACGLSAPLTAASGWRSSSTGGPSPTCPCSSPPTRGAPTSRCSIRTPGRSWHPSDGPFRSGRSSPASVPATPTPTPCGRRAGCSTKGGR